MEFVKVLIILDRYAGPGSDKQDRNCRPLVMDCRSVVLSNEVAGFCGPAACLY